MKKIITVILISSLTYLSYAQEDTEVQKSVIQEYTPSKL